MPEYYMIITDAGAALETAAKASGVPVELAQFAVGDGGGAAVVPDPAQTVLIHEVYRGDISSLTVNPDDPTVLDAQCVIPPDSGGYTVREIGIYTPDGTLYAVGNYVEQQKPDPSEGLTIEMDIKVELAVSDISTVTLVYSGQSFLTPDQADTLYLRQDKQLGEIASQGAAAQTEARKNIGCGTAATGSVVTSSDDSTPGRIPMTGWMGWGGPEISLPDGTDIYKFFPTAISGNYGGGGDLLNSTSGGWHSFKWQQHGSDHKYGFLLEQISHGQMAVHVYNNPNGDMTTPENYWTKYLSYSQAYKPTASEVDAVSASNGGTFQKPISVNNVSSTAPFQLNGAAPCIVFNELDSGSKKYIFVADGGNFRLDEDSTAGNNVFSWNSGENTFGVNGEVVPSNYANFDARYLAADYAYSKAESNARYVQGVRQGTQGGVIIEPDKDVLTPNGSYAMGYHFEGENPGGDTIYYRALQVNVNGVWSTIGYNTAQVNPTVTESRLPTGGLTRLNNLTMYRPGEEWPDFLMNFIDASGYPWHLAAPSLTGNIFIAYDGDGLIQQIDTDATKLNPLNLSVAGLKSLPDSCRINSGWKFDGKTVFQDADLVRAATLNANTARQSKLAAKATIAISMINASASISNPRDGDADNLLALQQYVDQLRDVDLTAAKPSWPVEPSFIF